MIPKKFLGIGIRKHVANFLGVNLSDVGLSVEEDDLSNNNEEVSVPKPKENKGSFGFGKKKQENVATEMQEKIKLDNTGSKIDAVKSEAENFFGLDSKTYLGGVNASMKPNIEIANAMNVNNQLLKEILQKINTGGSTVVNNNNSTSLVGNDSSIKNYREMYA
jgi:predicted RNA-binding protein Jag